MRKQTNPERQPYQLLTEPHYREGMRLIGLLGTGFAIAVLLLPH